MRVTIAQATPTLDTNAYADGDHMGTLVTVDTKENSRRPLKLTDFLAHDKDDVGAAFDVLLFNEAPTIASSDNGALNITDAEMAKCVGALEIGSGNYVDCINSQIALLNNINRVLQPDADGKLYALCVARGAATRTASGLVLNFTFESDR